MLVLKYIYFDGISAQKIFIVFSSHYKTQCICHSVRKSGLYNIIQASITCVEYKPNHVNACLKSILNPHKCASIYLLLNKTKVYEAVTLRFTHLFKHRRLKISLGKKPNLVNTLKVVKWLVFAENQN